MSNLEKIKKHLSKPIPITIKNIDGVEDVFYFKPLNVEQQAILMELGKIIQSREIIEVDGKKLPDVKKEDMIDMFNLILDIVKGSIEDIDEKTAEEFVNSNFEQLSESIFELMPENKSNEQIKLIKKRKEEIKNVEQTEESTE